MRFLGGGRAGISSPADPRRERHVMEYEFTQGEPISEQEALDQIAAMGFHGLAFDSVHDDDSVLHWHEFESVSFVISGTGSFADEHGTSPTPNPGAGSRLRPVGCIASWPAARAES